MPKLLKIYLFCTILKFCHIYFRSCQICHFWCPMCIPWIIKILLTTNLQQKSPCPPCVPWITKISGSPTYKKMRRYSHTASSRFNLIWISFLLLLLHLQIYEYNRYPPNFPPVFFVIHGFYLKILLKIFVKMSSIPDAIPPKPLPRSEVFERILVKDFC